MASHIAVHISLMVEATQTERLHYLLITAMTVLTTKDSHDLVGKLCATRSKVIHDWKRPRHRKVHGKLRHRT